MANQVEDITSTSIQNETNDFRQLTSHHDGKQKHQQRIDDDDDDGDRSHDHPLNHRKKNHPYHSVNRGDNQQQHTVHGNFIVNLSSKQSHLGDLDIQINEPNDYSSSLNQKYQNVQVSHPVIMIMIVVN